MLTPVRATVALDEDVEAALHRLMTERGLSLQQALNAAVRAGTSALAARAQKSWTQPRDLGAVADLQHALCMQVEDAELARSRQSRH